MIPPRPRSCAAPAVPILTAAILALTLPRLSAATETWNVFTGTANFALDANWLDGTQPLSGDPTLDLFFTAAGAQTYTANNNILGLLLNTLTFTSSSTGTINLTGNALDFRTDNTPPAINQNGSGAASIANEIIASEPLFIGGTGTGLLTLSGPINGAGALTMSATGRVLLTNVSSTYSGGTTITNGVLEITTTVANGTLDLPAFAPSALGSGGAVVINGGELRVSANGTGAILNAAAARPFDFGISGGTLNLNGRILNNAASTFSFNLASGGTAPLIRFNGGVNGVSSNNPADGNWTVGGNSLRISAFNNAGPGTPLMLQAINGATIELTAAYNAFPGALTLRGVAGGDPTGQGFERNTGRFFLVSGAGTLATYTFSSGLFLEDTIQICIANALRRIDAPITVRGTASGHPGNIAFAGRATGTVLAAPQLFPLVLGNDLINNRTLTIEGGGTANLDARIRTDQTHMNGVQVTALTDILAGGTVKIVQSWMGTGALQPSARPTGYIEVQGDIRGSGTAAAESVLEIQLPFRDGSALPAVQNEAGATFNPAGFNGADLIVNGSSAGEGGGLRIIATPRATKGYTANNGASTGLVFTDTGPVNVAKLNSHPDSSILAPARLAALTGTGGFLTIGAVDGTVPFPAGGEWAASVPVGLKVINSNTTGDDVSLSAPFQHNINLTSGASLNAGGQTLGPAATTPGLGLVQGTGAITGGVTIAPGGVLSPGFGLGTLTVGNLTLNGTFLWEATNTPASDLLTIAGNLALGASSVLSFAGGNSYALANYTLATYSGTLTGTFGSVAGLPTGFALNYGTGTNGAITLSYTSPTLVWDGNVSGAWNTATANWQGGAVFAQGDKVIFDDTAAGPNFTVTITGGNVTPSAITVNNTVRSYTLISAPGAALLGGATLVKTGTGTLTLSGPAGHTGGTQIDGGTLRLGASNSLPDVGTITVAAGAILDPQGNADTITALTVGGVVMGPGTLNVGNVTLGAGATIAANLVLAGDVAKAGTAGGTISGAIDLGGAARTFTVEAGTTPELSLNGAISNGGLTKAGNGLLALGAANSYSGPTTVQAGRLHAKVAGALPAGGNVTVAAGATLDSSALTQTLGALNLTGTYLSDGAALNVASLAGGALGVLDLAGGALTISGTANATYAGAIFGLGTTVTKTGSGTQHLIGASTYDGVTQISGGILGLGGVSAAGTSPVVVNAGASLDLGASITNVVNLNGGLLGATGGAIFQGTLNALASSTLRNADPENLSVESELDIRGNGLHGTADLLAQTNTGDGSADQGAGIRLRSTLPSTYSGTITVANTTKFELQTSVPGPFSPMGTGRIKMTGGTFTGGLQGTYSELNLRNNTGGDTIFGNDVEVIGTGITTMDPLGSAPAGARIGMGNLRLGAGHTLAVNRNTGNNLIVAFSSVTLTGGEAAFSPTTAGSGFTGTSDLALGPIQELAPSSFVMSGTTNLFLEGTNTFTGPLTQQSGVIRLGAPGALPAVSTLIVNGGTLDLSHPTLGSFDQAVAGLGGLGGTVTNSDFLNIRMLTVNAAADNSFLGQLTGALGLTKQGGGKLTLSSAHTHTGPTTIEGGSLVLGLGGSLSGSSPLQIGTSGKLDVTAFGAGGHLINAAQTLTGSGDWDGRIVLEGTLSPGPALATLTGDHCTLNGPAIMRLALSLSGNASDQLALTGSFDKGTAGSFLFDFENGGTANQIYTLVTFATTTFTAADFTFTGLAPGVTGSFQMTPNALQFVTIPEPGTAALLLSSLTLLGMSRRRPSSPTQKVGG